MNLTEIVVYLLVGLAVGWLSGVIMRSSFGIMGDLAIGVIGAFIGGFVLRLLGVYIGGGIVGDLVTALFGSITLVLLARLIFQQH